MSPITRLYENVMIQCKSLGSMLKWMEESDGKITGTLYQALQFGTKSSNVLIILMNTIQPKTSRT